MPRENLEIESFSATLRKQWQSGPRKIDWLAYEQFMDTLLKSGFSDEFKVRASKEALDAWTRRGHFDAKEYL